MGIFKYLKPKHKAPVAEGLVEMPERTVNATELEFASHSESAITSEYTMQVGFRPTSLYPVGGLGNSQAENLNEIKCDIMVNWLYHQQMKLLWTTGGYDEGVIMKKNRDQYLSCPADLIIGQHGLFEGIEQLNVRVSVGVRTNFIFN